MYVSVTHAINDPASFQTRGRQLTSQLPAGLVPLQFLPDAHGTRAVCLWQADSVQSVRDHVDGCLGDASEQEYFAVADRQALGLPVAQNG